MVLGATVMGDDFSAVQISIMVVMISSNLAAQLYERRLNQRSEQTIISY